MIDQSIRHVDPVLLRAVTRRLGRAYGIHLLHRCIEDDARAIRLVENAIEGLIHRDWRTLTASVRLGPSAYWVPWPYHLVDNGDARGFGTADIGRDGGVRLTGTELPETLVIGLGGHPLRSVIDHPDLPEDALVSQCRRMQPGQRHVADRDVGPDGSDAGERLYIEVEAPTIPLPPTDRILEAFHVLRSRWDDSREDTRWVPEPDSGSRAGDQLGVIVLGVTASMLGALSSFVLLASYAVMVAIAITGLTSTWFYATTFTRGARSMATRRHAQHRLEITRTMRKAGW